MRLKLLDVASDRGDVVLPQGQLEQALSFVDLKLLGLILVVDGDHLVVHQGHWILHVRQGTKDPSVSVGKGILDVVVGRVDEDVVLCPCAVEDLVALLDPRHFLEGLRHHVEILLALQDTEPEIFVPVCSSHALQVVL